MNGSCLILINPDERLLSGQILVVSQTCFTFTCTVILSQTITSCWNLNYLFLSSSYTITIWGRPHIKFSLQMFSLFQCFLFKIDLNCQKISHKNLELLLLLNIWKILYHGPTFQNGNNGLKLISTCSLEQGMHPPVCHSPYYPLLPP